MVRGIHYGASYSLIMPSPSQSPIQHTRLMVHTLFGIGRVTIYLLLPALTAGWATHLVASGSGIIKALLFVCAFIFSWCLIGVDYWFLMRKISIIKKETGSPESPISQT